VLCRTCLPQCCDPSTPCSTIGSSMAICTTNSGTPPAGALGPQPDGDGSLPPCHWPAAFQRVPCGVGGRCD
jgi:hypothetical protein